MACHFIVRFDFPFCIHHNCITRIAFKGVSHKVSPLSLRTSSAIVGSGFWLWWALRRHFATSTQHGSNLITSEHWTTIFLWPTYLIHCSVLFCYFISRAYSLIWEVKQVERNARLYNEEESQIVRNSSRLVTVLNAFIRWSFSTFLGLFRSESFVAVFRFSLLRRTQWWLEF